MRTDAGELTQLVEAGSQQIVGAVRGAAAEGFDVAGLTEVLKVAFACRNQIDAAIIGAIGALDQAAEKAPDGEVTMGLSCGQLAQSPPADQLQRRPRPGPPGPAAAFPARHRQRLPAG